jgi:hypothetical protein
VLIRERDHSERTEKNRLIHFELRLLPLLSLFFHETTREDFAESEKKKTFIDSAVISAEIQTKCEQKCNLFKRSLPLASVFARRIHFGCVQGAEMEKKILSLGE